MKVNYRYEYYTNPEYGTIHFEEAVTDSEKEQNRKLLALLAGIEGVSRGYVGRSRISVTVVIEAGFEREEVMEQVRDAIATVLVLQIGGQLPF